MIKQILTLAVVTALPLVSIQSIAQTRNSPQYSEFQQGPVQVKSFRNNNQNQNASQLLQQQSQAQEQSPQNQQGSSVSKSEKINSSQSQNKKNTNVSDETWNNLVNQGQLPQSKTMTNYFGVDDYSPAYNPRTR